MQDYNDKHTSITMDFDLVDSYVFGSTRQSQDTLLADG